MQPAFSRPVSVLSRSLAARSPRKGFFAPPLATALTWSAILAAPLAAIATPGVEFDFARVVECRDVTPPERIAQYPAQRLVEVSLPVSVRFNELSAEDIEEIHIEVSGAAAGLRVQDFAPATQLASEITREIETTTMKKKARSLDATLGATLPVPGAEAVAHLTPSIGGGLSGCESATEKINRLPPKHVVVVSGTYAESRGVFFKLKRTSQTSLEGVHELAVTFVAPRAWSAVALQVECEALGQRKMLWMKQDATLGHVERYVQMMAAAPAPIRQTVLKPTDPELTDGRGINVADSSAASPTKWRPNRILPPVVPPAAPAAAAPVKKSVSFTTTKAKAEISDSAE